MRTINSLKPVIALTVLLSPIAVNAFSLGDIVQSVGQQVAVDQASKAVNDSISGQSQQETNSVAPTFNFDVTGAKAFSGKNELAIGGFKVSFITSQKGTSSNRGSFMSGGSGMARASANVNLTNVSDSVFQEITDQAYKDFVSQLKAKGYVVTTTDDLSKQAAFKAINTKQSPYISDEPLPALSAKAAIFAPKGEKLRLLAWQGAGNQGFGYDSPDSGFSKVAVESGTPVIDVHYVVHFANFGGHSSRNTASITVDQGVSLVQGSGLWFTKGYGGTFKTDQGRIQLKDAYISDKIFAEIQKQEESSTDKAGNVLAAGVGALFGGGTRALSNYEYKADASKYKLAAIDILEKANSSFLSKALTLR